MCLRLGNGQDRIPTDVIYFDLQKTFDSVPHPNQVLIISNLLFALIDFQKDRLKLLGMENYYPMRVM